MHDKHWTDDELVARLFDVGPEDGHLEACPDCARRWEAMQRRHENRATHIDPPEALLAAQRSIVRARVEGKSRKLRLMLVPSLAAALLLALAASILFKAISPKNPELKTISEDSALEEVFQVSSSTEPTAIEPVQSLFEEQQ